MSLQSITQILQTISTPCPVAKPTAHTGWDEVLKERKTKFEIDPLVCAVAHHRRYGHYSLSEDKEHIEANDVLKAKEIRQYYLKKYFWNTLKSDRPQSEYRSNAHRLLAIESNWHLSERECGLFVKLPAFYAEDILYDQFKATLNTTKETYLGKGTSKAVQECLEYLGKTFRWQGSKRTSYWFKDSSLRLLAYTTLHNHPFNQLFEEKIQTPQLFEFSYRVDTIVDMYYSHITSFSFVKE